MIKKIYFDMDGVLADFDRGVEELAGFSKLDQSDASAGQDDAMWEAIRAVPHFYDKLELMPGAREMFDYIYSNYGDRCEILTGIPKPKRGIATAGEDKIAWMHRVLAAGIKVNVVYKEEKKSFCKGEDCILIDDLERNIDEWKSNGGTGILHKSSEETLRIIKNLEDVELVRRIRMKDDQKAWETLCQRYDSSIKKQVNARLESEFDKDRRIDMYDDLYQEGWKAFVKAVKNYDFEKKETATFRTYVNSYIMYAVRRAFIEQLNSLGLTHRPDFFRTVPTVFIDSVSEDGREFDIPDHKKDDEESFYDRYIQTLIDSGEISDRGRYNATQRAIQILETLRLMTDEKHPITKAELARCLSRYRMLVHHNSVKPESENTLKSSVDELLLEIDPHEYREDIDDRYLVKYDGYREDRVAQNQRLKAEGGKAAESIMEITNLYYQHPFEYSELDKLIEIIAFSDLLSEEEKYAICSKLLKTSSAYYENPFVGKGHLKLNPRAVSGRYSGRESLARKNVAQNLHILQQAMEKMVQVQFTFNRYDAEGSLVPVSEKKHILSPYRLVVYHDEYYCIGLKMDSRKIWHYRVDLMTGIELIKDEEGKPVPVELISGGVPSAISATEWNPQKYMAEHLNMGYDEPQTVRIRIRNTDYTILQHWFGNNYRRLKNKSDDIFDVIEIKTSPSLIVSWALSYGDRVEILDSDIRKKIKKQLKKLKEMYKD